MPLYLKNHSQGEYVFDHGWADAFERAGGSYYPKLQAQRAVHAGDGAAIAGRGDAPTEETRNALLAAGAAAVKELNASSLHITFLTEDEWRDAGGLGYLQRTDQQFHWENRGYKTFDDFLDELSSSKRKNLRKERAAVREAGVEFDWLIRQRYHRSALGSLLRVLYGHRRPQMGPALSHARNSSAVIGASMGGADSAGPRAAWRARTSPAR